MKARHLFKELFHYKETSCTMVSDSERAIAAAVSSIKHHRMELEEFIKDHDIFLSSLRPVPVIEGPLVARLMADAAEKTNVGPMAAVAGVLADLAVMEMILDGSEVAVVENGGEISGVSNIPIDVALLAGDSPLSRTFGFRLHDFPIGVATSSGLFSHALSFGETEAATVFSRNAGLADAAATAVGNQVKGENSRLAIERGIEKALSIQGVDGAVIVYRGMVGIAGRVPQIIRVSTAETSTLPFVGVAPKLDGRSSSREVCIDSLFMGDCDS